MTNNLNIVAIGGGNSQPMLEAAVELTGVDKPNILIIPTARPTELAHEQSVANFGGFFRNQLGLKVTTLHDYYDFPPTAVLEEKMDEADLVYISGGDTDAMMRVWALHGIDKMLTKRALEGMTISGVSAGAIAPFTWGHSDSLSYKVPEYNQWHFMSVAGLGLLGAGITPHYDSIPEGHDQSRATLFRSMFEDEYAIWDTHNGFGIDNNAAIIVHEGKIFAISSEPQNGVTRLSIGDDLRVSLDRLQQSDQIPIDSL